MNEPCRIEMLGWLRAIQADRVIARFVTHKTGALLAYLAYHQRRSHDRGSLVELFWPESSPGTGRNNLSKALTSLRHQLVPPGVPPGAVICADRGTVQIGTAACSTDVAAFEAALQAAQRAGSSDRVTRLEAA